MSAVSISRRISKNVHANKKNHKGYLVECFLLQDLWFDNPTSVSELSDHIKMDKWDCEEAYFNDIVDPRVLEGQKATKGSKYNNNDLFFDTAMQGPFQAEFWQAMRVELHALINEFDSWDYLPNPRKNVIPSTWAFKIK